LKLLMEKVGAPIQKSEDSAEKRSIFFELCDEIREEFLKSVSYRALENRNDPKNMKELEGKISQIVKSRIGKAPGLSYQQVLKEIRDDILGYGPITDLINDPEIEEVMVNRYDRIFYEKNGRIYPAPDIRFYDEGHLRRIIFRIVDSIGRRVDESSPKVDARLPDGSRVNVTIPPIAPDGACMTIRKFKKKLTEEEYLNSGTFEERVLFLLKAFVKSRLNIMVTGGTGTGKTSLLNFLCSFIDDGERIITIEDDLELNIKKPNLIRLEARNESIEGSGRVTIRDLVINALRMRPDRLIVGEVRGGEAFDMLQAMNTGHDGSMSTGHANSPEDMLVKLESMVLMAENLNQNAIRSLIASGIDILIHCTRFPEDGSRKITRIVHVEDYRNGEISARDIMRFERDYKVKGRAAGEFKVLLSKDSPLAEKLRYYGGMF